MSYGKTMPCDTYPKQPWELYSNVELTNAEFLINELELNKCTCDKICDFQLDISPWSGFHRRCDKDLTRIGVACDRRKQNPCFMIVLLIYLVCSTLFSNLCLVAAQSPVSSMSNRQPRATSCPLKCICEKYIINNNNNNNNNISSSSTYKISCVSQNLVTLPQVSMLEMEITRLNLSHNYLNSIMNQSFSGLKNLQVLSLAFNEITQMESGSFDGLEQLTHLYLDHNQLQNLHVDVFKDIPSLVQLDISHNQLSFLPTGIFHNMPRLKSLNLGNNDLDVPPTVFSSSLQSLVHLDISDNPNFGVIFDSDMFSTLVGLDYLNMANTGLRDLDSLSALLSLDNFPSNSSLHHLNLSSNALTFLSTSQLDVLLVKVEQLDLSANPYLCDCTALSAVDWLHNHSSEITWNWILPECHLPLPLQGASLISLNTSQVKINCDLRAKCLSPEHFFFDETFNVSDCLFFAEHTDSEYVISTTTNPSSTRRIVYESIIEPYDPLLGWYTAAALGGMVVILMACVTYDKLKVKYAEYKKKRWRAYCKQIFFAAQAAQAAEEEQEEEEEEEAAAAAAAAAEEALEESMVSTPLNRQGSFTYSYTNEIAQPLNDENSDTEKDSAASDEAQHGEHGKARPKQLPVFHIEEINETPDNPKPPKDRYKHRRFSLFHPSEKKSDDSDGIQLDKIKHNRQRRHTIFHPRDIQNSEEEHCDVVKPRRHSIFHLREPTPKKPKEMDPFGKNLLASVMMPLHPRPQALMLQDKPSEQSSSLKDLNAIPEAKHTEIQKHSHLEPLIKIKRPSCLLGSFSIESTYVVSPSSESQDGPLNSGELQVEAETELNGDNNAETVIIMPAITKPLASNSEMTKRYQSLRADIHPDPNQLSSTETLSPIMTRSVKHKPQTTAADMQANSQQGPNQSDNESQANQLLLQVLEQLRRELRVKDVHPECPIHNPEATAKLQTRIEQNPDQSLTALLSAEAQNS